MLQYENVFKANNTLYARVFNSESKTSSLSVVKFTPSYFIKTDKESRFKSILNNDNLIEQFPHNDKEYKDSINLYKSSDVTIYGNRSPESLYIRSKWPTPTDSDHNFHTLYIDIETMIDKNDPHCDPLKDWKPNGSERAAMAIITSIQIYDTRKKEFYIFGLNKDWDNSNNFTTIHGKINYFKMATEEAMLKAFISLLNGINPTLIVGYNSFGYDFPYIIVRIMRVLDGRNDIYLRKGDGSLSFNKDTLKGGFVKQLSPVGVITVREVETSFGKQDEFVCKGIFLEDYLALYKKYAHTVLTSYSLGSVAEHELGSSKINHDEFTDFGDFYNNHFNKFIEYGIQDVILLIELDEKLKLIDLAKTIAYICGVNMDDVRGTVKQWNSYMFNEYLNNNIVLPIENNFDEIDTTIFEHVFAMNDIDEDRKKFFEELYYHQDETGQYDLRGQKFAGGVTRGTSKVWDYIYYLDFASLYPSALQWANIGLDTLIIPSDLPKELLDVRAKYATYYPKNLEAKDLLKHDFEYIQNVINNKEVSNELNSIFKKHNVTMTPNGMFFRNDKRSTLSTIAGNLISQRKIFKKEMQGHYKKIKELGEEKKLLLKELEKLENESF